MKKRLILGIFFCFFMLFSIKMTGACEGGPNPFGATQIQVPGQDDGEVENGADDWYYFDAPTVTNDEWLILRLTGQQERGTINYEILDEQLNSVKGSYTLSGSHVGEIVCRMENTIEGTVDTFIPRLLFGKRYYIRLSGSGEYLIDITTYEDDYPGSFSRATALTTGVTTTGYLERDDDIDSFKFQVPNGNAYNIKIFATKKMNVRISDADNYTLNTNALRVMRDNSTSEYTVSGYGDIRYFFLYGSGGTKYTINVTVAPTPNNNTLGSWTQVLAQNGNNFINITTRRGAKVTIIVKKKSGNGRLRLTINNKKKYTKKQKQATRTYWLNRPLLPGDKVIITIRKKRYKDFHAKIKIQ
ncbi:hypothetical protein [Butyrivibrio sp. AC2005]|uniref:hypothetical protein n=1 Tax=Butyrivibrio sp. AC2005 TaxID=1280672 RepID=UPI00047D76B4|nr:hypothetical protein [Butyrivibrio sp. AC2005]